MVHQVRNVVHQVPCVVQAPRRVDLWEQFVEEDNEQVVNEERVRYEVGMHDVEGDSRLDYVLKNLKIFNNKCAT